MLRINPTSGEAEEISLFDLMDGAVKERAAEAQDAVIILA